MAMELVYTITVWSRNPREVALVATALPWASRALEPGFAGSGTSRAPSNYFLGSIFPTSSSMQ